MILWMLKDKNKHLKGLKNKIKLKLNLKLKKTSGMEEKKLTECLLTNSGMMIRMTPSHLGKTRREDATVRESIMDRVTQKTKISRMTRKDISDSAQFLEPFILLWFSTSLECTNTKKPSQMKSSWKEPVFNSTVILNQEAPPQLNISTQT
jgi:hypothetical protein